MTALLRSRPYAVGIAIVALACAILLFLFHERAGPSASASSATTSTVESASSAIASIQPPPNSTFYQSTQYDFSLYYPDDLTASAHLGPADTIVVLFQNEAAQQGFQIFIAPYDQSKITQQRFLMDEPSGVMDDPTNLTVDGAPATEFYSTNPAMGASCEIWFLQDGFLYEVTAPKPLASWLLQIMETWQFT